jgi:sulfide:quinone oxidoreductase
VPTNVLIAGGGPAALEAALSLHRLAGDRVTTIVLAPGADVAYRPLSVLAPFAAGAAPIYPLARMAADAGFTHVPGKLAAVDAAAHTVTTGAGARLAYDVLLVASGAVPVESVPGATTFSGTAADQEHLHGIVQDVEGGYLRRLAFVVPDGRVWPLPLYELALMLAERADSMWVDLELHVVTPEPTPLAVFGEAASHEVAGLLSQANITLHSAARVELLALGRLRVSPSGELVDVQRIVALPRLRGPAIPGLPADAEGFLPVDAHSRVLGVPDVYAAGDATAFPIKQGGIACEQADAAAAAIAARAGAPVDPKPFTPVLRGVLLTEREARYLRREATGPGRISGRALWWPPAKIAGRELAGYLEGLDEAAGRPPGFAVNVAIGDGDTGEIEVLSLH